jgi:patatin-related protein
MAVTTPDRSAAPQSDVTAPPHEVAFTQEIRFAVVMYGGVSLAIYINGVAQELLKLVRATAPRPSADGVYRDVQHSDAALHGSELVYRKLGRMLAHGKPRATLADAAQPIRTRFVVDVLSGTSAGGINAIYLAKALANDQSIDELKDLWIKEGHIGTLINDDLSLPTTRLTAQREPRSLLNSQRMYWKLLDAIEAMDDQNADRPAGPSPNVDELDLYITATDTQGQIIRIALADGIATERRHRSVFHFRYSNACFEEHQHPGERIHNDFKRENNPFLTFVARCTSAFPVAFEPMSLRAINSVISLHNRYAGKSIDLGQASWQPFYAAYGEVANFLDRSFSDGGVLDNYPFSYASDALPSRSATLPVDRKLLYVEPAPENPIDGGRRSAPPDFLANAWLSLSTLPRYETIRDDLQNVLDRNRLIDRVERIILGMENDLVSSETAWHSGGDFDELDLQDMMRLKGRGWIGYQRLRVAETTDELAALVARGNGYDRDSAQFQAIRRVIRHWRDKKYQAIKPRVDPSDAQTLNSFLFGFDLAWHLRRLKFMSAKIDELLLLEAPSGAKRAEAGIDEYTKDIWQRWDVIQRYAGGELFSPQDVASWPKTLDLLHDRLRRVKQQLHDAMILLRQCLAYLRSGDLRRPIHELLAGWGIDRMMQDELKEWTNRLEVSALRGQRNKQNWNTLEQSQAQQRSFDELIKAITITDQQCAALLAAPDEQAQNTILNTYFPAWQPPIDAFAQHIAATFMPVLLQARRICDLYLPDPKPGAVPYASSPSPSQPTNAAGVEVAPPLIFRPDELAPVRDSVALFARKVVRYYFDNFDDFDMILYPIFYATQVGDELDVVEVFRISPQDAPSLDPKRAGSQKLAGDQLGHFGAFFKETFRANDILWGQLDGAERIITALLPGKDQADVCKELIKEAHCAILAEEIFAKEFGYREELEIRRFVEQATAEIERGTAEQHKQDLAAKFSAILAASPLADKTWPLQAYLGGRNPVDDFQQHYQVDRTLNSVETVRFAARASKVFGKMLEGHALAQRLSGNRMIWVTRIAQLFWALVEVAIPDSVPHLIFRHWLKLLYFFEALMVLLGTLLLNQAIQQFGFIAFLVTIVTQGAVLFLGDRLSPRSERAPPIAANKAPMRRRTGVANQLARIKYLIVAFVAATSTLGLMVLISALGATNFWPFLSDIAAPEARGGWAQQGVRGAALLVVVLTFVLAAAADLGPTLRHAAEEAGGGWFAAAKWLLRVLAPLMGIAVFVMALLDALSSSNNLPAGFRLRVIALELAQNVEQLKQVVASYGSEVQIQAGLALDSWLFIPLYLLLFVALAFLLARSDTPRGKWLGVLLAACAVGAALADLLENAFIGAAVATSDPQMVASMHVAALTKWWLFVALMALLALVFFARRKRAGFLSALYLLIAAIGALGLAFAPPLVEQFYGLIGVALIFSGEAVWRIGPALPLRPIANLPDNQ